MSSTEKAAVPADRREADDIGRRVRDWLNGYPGLREDGSAIRLEPFLEEKRDGMMLKLLGNRITKRYILGGHESEYRFRVLYRLFKPGSEEQVLTALRRLNGLGDYAAGTEPDLGEAARFKKCQVLSQAEPLAVRPDGCQDYQIHFKLTYEVC